MDFFRPNHPLNLEKKFFLNPSLIDSLISSLIFKESSLQLFSLLLWHSSESFQMSHINIKVIALLTPGREVVFECFAGKVLYSVFCILPEHSGPMTRFSWTWKWRKCRRWWRLSWVLKWRQVCNCGCSRHFEQQDFLQLHKSKLNYNIFCVSITFCLAIHEMDISMMTMMLNRIWNKCLNGDESFGRIIFIWDFQGSDLIFSWVN